MGVTKTSLPALIGQLLNDGVAVARAEVDLQKTKITTRITAAKSGIILFAAAGVVALLALVGGVVGAVLALATLVGPGFAGLIVLVALLIVAAILGLLGSRQLSTPPQAIVETLP